MRQRPDRDLDRAPRGNSSLLARLAGQPWPRLCLGIVAVSAALAAAITALVPPALGPVPPSGVSPATAVRPVPSAGRAAAPHVREEIPPLPSAPQPPSATPLALEPARSAPPLPQPVQRAAPIPGPQSPDDARAQAWVQPVPRGEEPPATAPSRDPEPAAEEPPRDWAAKPAAEAGAWQSKPQPELTRRAEELLARGDVTSARLWLSEAADAGDAAAVFKLAETYDPTMLREWGVMGLTSDTAKARTLYAKALTGGIVEAGPRLDRLGR